MSKINRKIGLQGKWFYWHIYQKILKYISNYSGLWLKVQASRRQRDPRKSTLKMGLMIMVRLRSKTYRYKIERASSAANPSEPSSRRVWGQKPGQLNIQKYLVRCFFLQKIWLYIIKFDINTQISNNLSWNLWIYIMLKIARNTQK